MGTSALPDMYARSQRVAGQRAEGIHIRQSTSALVLTNMLHFLKSAQILITLANSTYIYSRMHIVIVVMMLALCFVHYKRFQLNPTINNC